MHLVGDRSPRSYTYRQRRGGESPLDAFADPRPGQEGPPQAPFDRIIVTAAALDAPAALLDQLKNGGRMIIPLGETRDSQALVQIDKTEEGLVETPLLPVRFVPLVHGRVKRD